MSVYRRNYALECGAEKHGGEVWAYDFSHRHVRCRRSGFATKSDALLAESIARERLLMHSGLSSTLKVATFSKMCQGFLASRELTSAPSTVLSEKFKARQAEKVLGKMIVSLIQTSDITAYRDKRLREGVSHRTANLELIFVRCVLNYAIEQGFAEINPSKRIKMLREVKRDKPIPSDDQLLRLIGEAENTTVGHQLSVWIWFSALTGLRPSESFHVEWRDVDFTAGRVFVRPKQGHSLKTGKFRVVEIHPHLMRVLLEWRSLWESAMAATRKGRTHDWVFFNPRRQSFRVESFAKAFESARGAAGLNGLGITAYSLRHYFISKAIMSGVDIFTVAKWSGHSSTKMIDDVYGHLSPSFRAAQMAKIQIAHNKTPEAHVFSL